LTLVGPGGIGKTRLAVEVASKLPADFTDGILFVALQSLNLPEHIILAIAQALHYQLAGTDEPAHQLFRYLANKRALLILDNFDHLLAGAALISDLLLNAPAVVILTTSRERLNLLEECVFEVNGLERNDSHSKNADAVKLFEQTAQRARPGFSLANEYPYVIEICRLVEGMPLAIELAASWVQRLPIQVILEEIQAGLNIFESRARNVPERHRNMRAAIDYSWGLLREAEQNVFKKISVFRGGFRREAAQEVAGATLWELATLVDKSLLRIDANGRYDMHELIRQYGEEKLGEEREQIHDLHCAYYMAFLAQRSKHLRGAGLKEALTEIGQEIGNIRAAWDWAITRIRIHYHTTDEALDGFWFFYDIHSWNLEAEKILRNVAGVLEAEKLSREKPVIVARILARVGTFCASTGRFDEAKRLVQKSLEICRLEGAVQEVGFCLLRLTEVDYLANNLLESKSYLEESLTIFTTIGDTYGRAFALGYLGFSYHVFRDQERARRLLEESVALFQKLDDAYGTLTMEAELTAVLMALGDYEKAQHFAEEGLHLSQELGFKLYTAILLALLAELLYELGQTEKALEYALQALRFSIEMRRMHLLASALIACSHILAIQGKHEQALELVSLTRHHPATLGDGVVSIERLLAKLKTRLSVDQYAAALERGQKLELESAAQALLMNWEYRMKPPVGESFADALTGRELDVLRLAADGLTNPQIASELVFTVGTVKWYLHQIYTKLDVSNRTQAVARARELNLLA